MTLGNCKNNAWLEHKSGNKNPNILLYSISFLLFKKSLFKKVILFVQMILPFSLNILKTHLSDIYWAFLCEKDWIGWAYGAVSKVIRHMWYYAQSTKIYSLQTGLGGWSERASLSGERSKPISEELARCTWALRKDALDKGNRLCVAWRGRDQELFWRLSLERQ